MKLKLYIILFIISALNGCGNELDVSQFPLNKSPQIIGDTVYIPQSPVITGFNQPEDILIGNEPLIYIADKFNNRVVQMDISGALISYSNFILRPKKLAQDRNYDLLVLASVIDTIPPNILDTVDAVFRFKLQPNGGILSGVNPAIAFKSNQPTPLPGDHGSFTGIAAFSDNYYLVLRSGPNNTNPIDPDNAIFRIDKYDHTVPVPERLPGFEVIGQGLLSLLKTSAVTTFSFNNTDLIYTQIDPNAVFKVQWAVYDDIEGTYMPKFTPESNVDMLKNNLFSQPAAITIDDYSNIYVIDAQKDSLYKFSGNGMLKSESFGGHGSSLTQFSSPSGVAFFYKTLYICDSGNNRILRFILSTDIH
jgi:hypothetical protein